MKKLLAIMLLFAACNNVESNYPNNKASPVNEDSPIKEPFPNGRIKLLDRCVESNYPSCYLIQVDSVKFLIVKGYENLCVKRLNEK